MTLPRKKNGLDEIEGIVVIAALGGLGILLYKIYNAAPDLAKKTGDTLAKAAEDMASAARGTLPLETLVNASPDAVVPGTGQSVAQLVERGYTAAQINQMLADAVKEYGTPAYMSPEAGLPTASEIDRSVPEGDFKYPYDLQVY